MRDFLKNSVRLLACACAILSAPSLSADPLPEKLAGLEGKRVLWLGDSITFAGGYVADVEFYLRTHAPSAEFDFINAGLGSETVSGLSEEGHAGGRFPRPDLHERLDRVLEGVKPEIIFACYGMNCGIYLPFDEGRFAKYKEGMTRLHDKAVAGGVRIIHLTPPVYDSRGEELPYSDTLDRYSKWLISQRQEAGWEVVDLHFPMKRFLEKRRVEDPEFLLQKDRVHPGALGHWVMAKAILEGMGATDLKDVDSPGALTKTHPDGERLLQLIHERTVILRNAWLGFTKHLRPGVPEGLPMDQANTKADELLAEIESLVK
ncbi:MAG: SGNH/GDSL hydrolase family protein [Luteolibacter sp.]